MTIAEKPNCPFCKTGSAWKMGKIPTLNGLRQRYICSLCGKTFYLAEKEEEKE